MSETPYIFYDVCFQLEPGTSKDIFMPIIPNIVMGSFNISLEVWSFMDRDFFSKTIYVKVSLY